jgi:D,D-heptose 1,7-bisphosphate phosphatase
MEDPGYISEPEAVKLLPGVELAIKSLSQRNYKLVVVTNQSGVARGLLTEEALGEIHGELRRQLGAKGVHLDGIYYCPYHPEGTVEQYARESELRKPQPGMLLKAAEDLDIDLSASWMVGDSARDVEAGQRAGCKTIRVRVPHPHLADEDESVQADYTVRNLVDAARVILRQTPAKTEPPKMVPSARRKARQGEPTEEQPAESMDDSKVRQEILRQVRHLVAERQSEEFSATKLIGGIVQTMVFPALFMAFWRMLEGENQIQAATFWAMIAVALQVMSLTFFVMGRSK